MNLPLIIPLLVTIGGIVTIGGAWGQYFKELDSKAKADSLTAVNKGLLEKIATSADSNNDILLKSNTEISNLAKELIVAKNTIEALRNESVNNALGSADAYLESSRIGSKYVPVIGNFSDLPVFDLNLLIINYDEMLKCDIKKNGDYFEISNDCFQKTVFSSHASTLYGRSKHFIDFTLTAKKTRLRINYNTRKATYFQDFIFFPEKGEASVIYQMNGLKKVILKVVNEQNLEINWDAEFPYPAVLSLI